jgi:hypothetical protein
MSWAPTIDVAYVGKLAFAAIVFSQILQCKRYVRRMRNLERWRERDLEEGVGEEGEIGDGEELEAWERGSVGDW